MMYTEQLAHIEGYDATVEAHRFCYEQMLKHIAKLIEHVEAHGPHTPRAQALRVTVEHYRKNCNQLIKMLKEGK